VVIRAVGLCLQADVSFGPPGAANSGDSDSRLRESPFSQGGLRCDTRPHAVEIPIRDGFGNVVLREVTRDAATSEATEGVAAALKREAEEVYAMAADTF